nr:hypothetical protein [Tanacetum cinerariifolium]
MKLQESLDEEAIFEEQMLAFMHRFVDSNGVPLTVTACASLDDVVIPRQSDATHIVDRPTAITFTNQNGMEAGTSDSDSSNYMWAIVNTHNSSTKLIQTNCTAIYQGTKSGQRVSCATLGQQPRSGGHMRNTSDGEKIVFSSFGTSKDFG